jgi:hypothetical protein
MALISRGIKLDVISKLETENPGDMDLNLALCLIESAALSSRPNSATVNLEMLTTSSYNFVITNNDVAPTLAVNINVTLVSPFGTYAAATAMASSLGSVSGTSQQTVTLKAGMTYTDIAQLAAQVAANDSRCVSACLATDLVLYWVKPKSGPSQKVLWREEISSTATDPDADKYAICLKNIKNDSVIELRTSRDNVGARLHLTKIAADFRHNNSMVGKINKLETAYVGFRRMRGDGNCYYRAVIFGLLEQIIESERRHLFLDLHRCFNKFISGHARYISEDEVQLYSNQPANNNPAVSTIGTTSSGIWQSQIKRFLDVLSDAAGDCFSYVFHVYSHVNSQNRKFGALWMNLRLIFCVTVRLAWMTQ